MKHIPAWFPGARFQTLAREWRHTLYSLTDGAYNFVLGQMVRIRTYHRRLTRLRMLTKIVCNVARLLESLRQTLSRTYWKMTRRRHRTRTTSSGPPLACKPFTLSLKPSSFRDSPYITSVNSYTGGADTVSPSLQLPTSLGISLVAHYVLTSSCSPRLAACIGYDGVRPRHDVVPRGS